MPDLLERVRQRKLLQWALAYLAGAWAVLQVLDVFGQNFDWPHAIFRVAVVVLAVGFPTALLIAWYHGQQGRQRIRRLELALLSVLLLSGATAVAFVARSPEKVSRRPGGPAPTSSAIIAASAIGPAPPLADRYLRSPAYDDFLRGKVKVSEENAANDEAAIELLEKAVKEDPDFAPAYAELARAYNVKAFFLAPAADRATLEEDAEVAIEKALALDPNLAEAHLARGLILWTPAKRFPHEQAVLAFRRALELNPRLDEARHQLALVYLHVGLLDRAWAQVDTALAIDPTNTLARFRYGVIDMYRGRYEEALGYFQSTPLETNPSLWAFQTATALFRTGRDEEARALLDRFLADYPDDPGGVGTSVRAMMLAKAGKREEAEAAIASAIRLGRGFGHFHHTAYNIASAYAMLGEPEAALRWLEAAVETGFPCYPLYAHDAQLDNLRRDPRFIAFLAELKAQYDRYRATL